MSRSWCGILAGAALGVALAACASSPAASADPGTAPDAPPVEASGAEVEQIRVTVVHNRTDGGSTTVYVEPTGGTREAVGTLESGTTRTFTYRVQGATRQIRLIAVTASGQPIESEPITIPPGAQVSWDLQLNSVRIRR
jgi:hypothetical protein